MKRQQSLRQEAAVAALVELFESTRRESDFYRPYRFYGQYLPEPPVVICDSGPLGDRQPRGRLLPDWLRQITGEECFHRVVAIYLAGRNLQSADLKNLQTFHYLESLNLDGCTITDEALKQLLSLDQLNQLCLGGTDITDKGLADLSRMKQLREVELWHTDLTDEGIAELASLRNLKRINLCGTEVTGRGIEQLQLNLPTCKIWWDRCHSFRMINRSPTGRDNPNPADLVRAVNHLHSLGHDGAIEVLQEYVRVAPGEDITETPEAYDQSRLFLIMPLLFERKNPQQGIPIPPRFLGFGVVKPATRAKWLANVTVESDIPFHDVVVNRESGEAFPGTNLNYLVEWAETACRLRRNPLRPDHDPFAAADRVEDPFSVGKRVNFSSSRYKDPEDPNYAHWLKQHLRQQAQRMVSHLNLENPEEAKLRWSDERQEYVLAEAPRE